MMLNGAHENFHAIVNFGDNLLAGIGSSINVGAVETFTAIINYLASFAVVFTSVAIILFIVGCYFQDELSKPLHELLVSLKNSAGYKLVFVFYGFRAFVITCINKLKPGV